MPLAGLLAAPTTRSPGNSRISVGPWAMRPITGRLASLIASRNIRPVLLATTSSSSSRQATTRCSSTPSLSLRMVAARPESSRNSSRGKRLKRPSVLSRPRVQPGCFGSGNTWITRSPSRLSGRNFSNPPLCCPANSQRSSATLPAAVKASKAG